MNTIEVKVIDYYNRPEYYPYMPDVIFKSLESAFLESKETTEVPKDLFDKMVNDCNNIK